MTTHNTDQRNDAVIDWLNKLADRQSYERGCAFYLGKPDPEIALAIEALSQPPASSPLEGEVREALEEIKVSAGLIRCFGLTATQDDMAADIIGRAKSVLAALSTEAGKPAPHPDKGQKLTKC